MRGSPRPYSFRSDGFSSTTRVTVIELRPDVMPETAESSARAVTGATTCHPPSAFLSVVVSPDAALRRSSSILSSWMDAKTFSCFDSVPSVGDFFQVTK